MLIEDRVARIDANIKRLRAEASKRAAITSGELFTMTDPLADDVFALLGDLSSARVRAEAEARGRASAAALASQPEAGVEYRRHVMTSLGVDPDSDQGLAWSDTCGACAKWEGDEKIAPVLRRNDKGFMCCPVCRLSYGTGPAAPAPSGMGKAAGKQSDVFVFEPGSLTVHGRGYAESEGSGYFQFDESDLDFYPHDEKEGSFIRIRLDQSELVELRDFLVRRFPSALRDGEAGS